MIGKLGGDPEWDSASGVPSSSSSLSDAALLDLIAGAPPQPIVPLPQIGEIVQGDNIAYTIQADLGRGGSARVYKALGSDGQNYTFKLSRFRGGDIQQELELHWRPGRAIQVRLGQGDYHGYPFLVYNYLHGETLQEKISRGRLELDEALWISLEVSRLMRRLHDANIIHRDIKPGNIFIDQHAEPEVWLLDLGLAIDLSKGPPDRLRPVGTPFYVAPKQALDGTADESCDIFSAAVTLYACLGGSVPVKPRTCERRELVSARLAKPELAQLKAPRSVKRIIASATSRTAPTLQTSKQWESALKAARRKPPFLRLLSDGLALASLATMILVAVTYQASKEPPRGPTSASPQRAPASLQAPPAVASHPLTSPEQSFPPVVAPAPPSPKAPGKGSSTEKPRPPASKPSPRKPLSHRVKPTGTDVYGPY